MRTARIITKQGTIYEIDEDGCFLRYNEHKWNHPHESWEMRGLTLYQFGQYRYFIRLSDFFEMAGNHQTNWTFKNGKPRYFIADIDHGTNRMQSDGISRAFII
jgi:hypothetical protein